MKRKYAWIAICVALWTGTVLGQPMPYGGYPGVAYPGLPTPPTAPYAMPPGVPYGVPYGPMPPTPPMPPLGPNGPQSPIPMDPRLPVGPRPMPVYPDAGAKSGANEPYLVQPDPGKRQTLPDMNPNERTRLIDYFTGPNEPYTTYEGNRYEAAARHDCTHTWIQANYIHWWVRRDNTPPLVTTGDPLNPFVGIIGNPDTVVLLGGGGKVAPDELNGVQLTFGMWVDPERLQSLEIGGFWLGRGNRQYSFIGDATGNPAFGQPVIIGGAERALLFSQPGIFAGRLDAHATLDFHGLELNIGRNILRVCGWSVDSLFGARYLYMNDSLTMNQNVTVLPAGTGFIPFNGTPQPDGSNFIFNDTFETTNRFFGGTFGARVNWACGPFDVGATAKVSLGATRHTSNVAGTTTFNGTTVAQGSSLAQASNIGQYTSTDFSVVPEFNVALGFQATSRIRLTVGYNVMDWSRVLRVGNQIDRNIDFTQVPTSPTFVPGSIGTRPVFPNTRTDFWAQGINLGIELKF